MKNIEDVLKQLSSSLLHVGDVERANIIAVDANGAKVVTEGHCIGYLHGEVPQFLTQGTSIEVEVSHFHDGLPYFQLSEAYAIQKLPQEATVRYSTRRALAVELLMFPEVYGIYNRKENDNVQAKIGDRVIVSQLQKGDDGNYLVGKIEAAPTQMPEKKPRYTRQTDDEEALVKNWSQTKKNEVAKEKNSRKVLGKARLGDIAVVTPYNEGKEVKFSDGTLGKFTGRFCASKDDKSVRVRVVHISKETDEVSVELIRSSSVKPQLRPKNDNINHALQEAALKAGSILRVGGYYVGGSYYLIAKDGKPFFSPAKAFGSPEFDIDEAEVIIQSGNTDYKDGDTVHTEVAFIEKIGEKKYKMTVNVLSFSLF